jgi:hypothetical protein
VLLTGIEGVTTVNLETESDGAGRTQLVVEYNGDDAEVSAILARLVTHDIPVIHFNEDVRDLEAVFMQATKGIVS